MRTHEPSVHLNPRPPVYGELALPWESTLIVEPDGMDGVWQPA